MPTIVTILSKEGDNRGFNIVEKREGLDAYLGYPPDKAHVSVRPHPKKPGHKIVVDGRSGPHVGPHWRGIHELRHGVIAEWVSDAELQGQTEESTA